MFNKIVEFLFCADIIKTPKVFCPTFGVYFISTQLHFFYCRIPVLFLGLYMDRRFLLSFAHCFKIAIFTFPGILCLAECFFLAEYLLQESVQPFAKLVFEESEVVDRYLGLSRRSHFDDRGVAFGSCPVDVK